MSSKTQRQFRWNTILPWVELVFATIVGIVLYFPLQRKDLADIVWVFGLLFTFNSITNSRKISEEINKLKTELDAVRQLSKVVDLSQKCNVQEVDRILRLYIAIKEAEFRSLKDDAIQRCIKELSSLAYEKSTVASGSEYFIWLRDMLESCSSSERLIAVSVEQESAWIEVPAEKGYLDENIKAAKRGMKVERIFISSKERLRDKRNREVICQHMNEGLTAYIVWQDEIVRYDFTLLREVDKGFIVIGDRAVLIDTGIPPDEEAEGTVTIDSERIKRYRRLFERLKLHARIADTELFKELDNSSAP